MADLAATVGWTRQHLARRFGDELPSVQDAAAPEGAA